MKKIEKRSEGFGDTIAKFTAATGLDKAAHEVAKMMGYADCGCGDRREAMNKAFPYKKSK